MSLRLCIATANRHKLAEIALGLRDLPIHLVASDELDEVPDVVEDGATYADNARKKALAFREASGLASLADDSGLEIDALQGAPGVKSHRYGGESLAFPEKMAMILGEIAKIPPERRTARFRCALALAKPDGSVVVEEAACEGIIGPAPAGVGGFGYDPIFHFPPLRKSFAELSAEEKLAHSHRGKALAQLRPLLLSLAG